MKAPPWNSDDRAVLREKWQVANETATACERLDRELNVLRIRIDHVTGGTPEFETIAIRTREILQSSVASLPGNAFINSDWNWFTLNVVSDSYENMVSHLNDFTEDLDLQGLIRFSQRFVSDLARVKRKFAYAMQLSLNAKEENDEEGGKWYQKMDEGIQIYGILVKLKNRERVVLLGLCANACTISDYYRIAEWWDEWKDVLERDEDGSQESTKSTIRTSIKQIRSGLRAAFNLLGPGEDPLPSRQDKNQRGWCLDRRLLEKSARECG